MTTDEAKAWIHETTRHPGRWRVDGIHDGTNGQDFLAYKPAATDPTSGLYVMAMPDGRWHAGQYEYAYPHIGEAGFIAKASGSEADLNAAMKRLIEGLGAAFLVDLFMGAL